MSLASTLVVSCRFAFCRPSPTAIRDFLAAQSGAPYSYPEVGATHPSAFPAAAPALARSGYAIDGYHARVGSGEAAFARAGAALRRWQQFDLGWVLIGAPETPLASGNTVPIIVRVAGPLYTLNAARIVYAIDESAGPIRRFGFAYGTLRDHAERGEERFLVEWDAAAPGSPVDYEIVAFSRPAHPLARAGRPLARRLQRRFGRESVARVSAAVATAEEGAT